VALLLPFAVCILLMAHKLLFWQLHASVNILLCLSAAIDVSTRVNDIIITSLPKLIWEEGRVAAVSHTYAVKSPLATMARPKCAPKVSLPVDRSQTHYLPHPWTRPTPTYDAKRHPDVIRRFSTMHWTDQPTNARTDRVTDRSSTGKFDDYRPLRYESDAA